jgi:hypothetical protein
LVPYGLISRCRRCPRCCPQRLNGTFFLSLCSRKHTHKFFLSACLSKFGQGLCSACRPYVGLSKPTLDGFCDGHKDFLKIYRLLSTFSTVDHVKNAQFCVNRVNTHCGTYGGPYENRTSCSTGPQDPKSLILIWDTGASYGLTLFRSDFIDYVKCEIPVRDVTKVNTVVGIGTTLHKFTDINGNPVYLPCVSYHLPETDVHLFSPQTYH